MTKYVELRLITLLTIFVFIFSISEKGYTATLSDVPSSSATEINYLIEKGIITGYGDGTFRPKQSVTRAEAAIMLGKALELNGTQRATSFPDVGKSAAASGYIQSAVNEGIISGYKDGTYRPYNMITRGQMATLLQRGFKLSEKGDILFSDIPTSGSLHDAVNMITTAGLAAGYSDGTFRPYANVTRAEFALFIARGLNKTYRVSMSPKNVIAIDAGHGGHDSGAVGYNKILEKELNLDVALKVEQQLKEMGIGVVMTRRDDRYLELSERVEIAVNSNADTFVSIHGNSFNTTASGTETYYSTASTGSEDSKQLATFIQNRLYPALGTQNRGVKTANYYVIYKNPLPAALVELGFIDNQGDASKLDSDADRNKAADAIALGIQDYYNWKK